jgi:hypothetical protein
MYYDIIRINMRRTENQSYQADAEGKDVERSLQKLGVILLPKGGDEVSPELFVTLGIVKKNEEVRQINSVTHLFLNGKDFGGGWQRGGAESFYQVLQVVLASGNTHYIALKAIHTMGNIQEKVKSEALRMALLSKINRAPQVYAITPGTLIKEFILEDETKLSKEELVRDAHILLEEMQQLGIKPSFEFPGSILGASIQHNSRLYLIDAGSGDFEGPSK